MGGASSVHSKLGGRHSLAVLQESTNPMWREIVGDSTVLCKKPTPTSLVINRSSPSNPLNLNGTGRISTPCPSPQVTLQPISEIPTSSHLRRDLRRDIIGVSGSFPHATISSPQALMPLFSSSSREHGIQTTFPSIGMLSSTIHAGLAGSSIGLSKSSTGLNTFPLTILGSRGFSTSGGGSASPSTGTDTTTTGAASSMGTTGTASSSTSSSSKPYTPTISKVYSNRREMNNSLLRKVTKVSTNLPSYTSKGVCSILKKTKQLCITGTKFSWRICVQLWRDPGVVKLWWSDGVEAFLHTVKWMKTGFTLFGLNIRICYKLAKRSLLGYRLSLRDRRLLVRTTADIGKIIPFSLFIIIPFAELLLPVVIRIFPNLLPSTFFEKSYDSQNLSKILKAKKEMASFFQDVVDERTKADLLVDSAANITQEEAREEFVAFQAKLENHEFPTAKEVLRFARLFHNYFNFDTLPEDILTVMADILGLQVFGSKTFKAHLVIQLRHHVTRLRRDDREILWEGVESLSKEELIEACKGRAIEFTGNVDEMRQGLKSWLELSSHRSIPIALLLWIQTYYLSGKGKVADSALEEVTERMKEGVEKAAAAEATTKSKDGEVENMSDSVDRDGTSKFGERSSSGDKSKRQKTAVEIAEKKRRKMEQHMPQQVTNIEEIQPTTNFVEINTSDQAVPGDPTAKRILSEAQTGQTSSSQVFTKPAVPSSQGRDTQFSSTVASVESKPTPTTADHHKAVPNFPRAAPNDSDFSTEGIGGSKKKSKKEKELSEAELRALYREAQSQNLVSNEKGLHSTVDEIIEESKKQKLTKKKIRQNLETIAECKLSELQAELSKVDSDEKRIRSGVNVQSDDDEVIKFDLGRKGDRTFGTTVIREEIDRRKTADSSSGINKTQTRHPDMPHLGDENVKKKDIVSFLEKEVEVMKEELLRVNEDEQFKGLPDEELLREDDEIYSRETREEIEQKLRNQESELDMLRSIVEKQSDLLEVQFQALTLMRDRNAMVKVTYCDERNRNRLSMSYPDEKIPIQSNEMLVQGEEREGDVDQTVVEEITDNLEAKKVNDLVMKQPMSLNEAAKVIIQDEERLRRTLFTGDRSESSPPIGGDRSSPYTSTAKLAQQAAEQAATTQAQTATTNKQGRDPKWDYLPSKTKLKRRDSSPTVQITDEQQQLERLLFDQNVRIHEALRAFSEGLQSIEEEYQNVETFKNGKEEKM